MDDVIAELNDDENFPVINGDINGEAESPNNDRDGLRLEQQVEDEAMSDIGNANTNKKDDAQDDNDNVGVGLGEEKYNDLNHDSGFINQNNVNKPEQI